MRFILAVASMMIVFAAQNAAAFRAPAARGIVGGSGGGSGHLLRANGAIMRSHRHRHYDLRSSTSMAAYSNNANSARDGAATSAINLGNGNIVHQHRRRGWQRQIITSTRLHMSETTIQEESSTTTATATATTSSTSYPFATVEAKWQAYWKEHRTFATPSRRITNEDGTITRSTKKKKYVLDMFPYPSGAGLHVGHPEGYTGEFLLVCRRHQISFM